MRPGYEASFGPVKRKPMDWRALPDSTPDDDEELAQSPPEVVAMLGFDPRDVEKFNPHHDELGRFSTSELGSGGVPLLTLEGAGKNAAAIREGFNAIPIEDQYLLSENDPYVPGGKRLYVHNVPSLETDVPGDTIEEPAERPYAGLHTTATRDDSDPSLVYVADTVYGRPLTDAVGTTVHELGHALDRLNNWVPSMKFAPMVAEASRSFSNIEKQMGSHYLQNSREMFAELYRLAYSPNDFGTFFGVNRSRATRIMRKPLAELKRLGVHEQYGSLS